jgi:diaphanous 1
MTMVTGTIESITPVVPLVNATPPTSATQRHFSSFQLTSHLHTPVLRLVSLNALLMINLTFLRVPEIHDGYEYKFFISRTMTVDEVIERVMEELGLTTSLPIPGGGTLEYVVEEVWVDKNSESMVYIPKCCSTNRFCHTEFSRLPASSPIYDFIRFPCSPNPFSSSAKRLFRLCVPDEWYRRSKSRNMSTTSFETSESTLKRLGSLEESDEEDEDDGTAKLGEGPPNAHPTETADWKGSFSQNRLTSLFDGWLRPTSPTPPTLPHPSDNRISVSEPRLVEHHTGSDVMSAAATNGETEDVSLTDFDDMLVWFFLIASRNDVTNIAVG